MRSSNTIKALSTAIASTLAITMFAGCASTSTTSTAETYSVDISASSSSDNNDSLRTIRVGIMTGQPDQYAAFIGTEEGIFEKYGIKLETTEYAAGINTVDAIVNGTADTGLLADFAAVNRIGNTLENTNLNLFAELGISVVNSGGIYVAPEYATDPSSLDGSAGWTVSIGTVSEYFVWQAQTYLGLDPDKQNLVPTDSSATALAAATKGDVSATVATGAQAARYEEIGWEKIASPNDFGYKVGTYLVTTNEYLDTNTDLLADYLKALDESVTYINNNLDGVADRVSVKFGISPEDFKLNWSQYDLIIGSTEEGAVHLEDVGAWAVSHGKYPTEYNIRDYIRTEAIEKAFPDRVTVKK